ncbi:protein bicaudal C homolog 1-B-like [Daphnia pulicaria]|uniref:protein bicaudal C homolog 1-B-like n=1 Tax=Daphnia pulicaria TaxID=35523 RepID=UPI001EEA0BAF|nr:protein bicaudal C homolog 1-B-like [Daphnia pulicaria]
MQSLNKSLSAISLQSQGQSATLSMEVSYTFHSHLIGRSGQNINRVMEDTETRIHFPDRNRIAGESKSNSVVIRGPIANLENARQRIRADVPVEFIVDCNIERISSVGQTNLTHHFSSSFGVLLRFYPKIDGISCQVNIRGHQDRLQQLKDSVVYFGRLTDTLIDAVVVKVETSFDHVWLLRDQVDKIIAATGAGIRCPDVSVLKELPKKYCVWIRGSLDQVYKASTMLNGLLPMQLMAQVPSDRFNRCILADSKEADVMIRVERTTSDNVTIRFTSYEWNARNLYEMLRRCLELSSDQTVIPSLPSIWLELAELTQNTFILSSLKLAESSSSQSGPAQQQLSVIDVDIPQSSSTSSSDSGATSLSSPLAADSCIPASMAASRFDQNSSRHLSQLLDTVGLSHYADLFVQNEVDLAMFTTLKDEDFISIGIRSFGARKIMLNAIQELRR